jgi:hypothetical protein
VLNDNGAAWVRTSTSFEPPGLAHSDIGNQSYVGDLVQTWMIVHESGSAVVGSSRMPVVTSRGRPPDKATAASLTYDVGQVLRGALCMERESEDAIDKRRDREDASTPYRHTGAPRGPEHHDEREPDLDDVDMPDARDAAALRDLYDAIETYASMIVATKQATFKAACKAAKIRAAHPGELDADAVRTLLRLVRERMAKACADAYAKLDAAAPGDYPAEDREQHYCRIIGEDTWPEHPAHDHLLAVHKSLTATLAKILA